MLLAGGYILILLKMRRSIIYLFDFHFRMLQAIQSINFSSSSEDRKFFAASQYAIREQIKLKTGFKSCSQR